MLVGTAPELIGRERGRGQSPPPPFSCRRIETAGWGSAGRRSNSGVGRDQGIHACHLAELASIHCLAASSGVMFLFVIASATEFWSWLAHLKFLMNVAASPPVSMNFVRTILLRMYGG